MPCAILTHNEGWKVSEAECRIEPVNHRLPGAVGGEPCLPEPQELALMLPKIPRPQASRIQQKLVVDIVEVQ